MNGRKSSGQADQQLLDYVAPPARKQVRSSSQRAPSSAASGYRRHRPSSAAEAEEDVLIHPSSRASGGGGSQQSASSFRPPSASRSAAGGVFTFSAPPPPSAAAAGIGSNMPNAYQSSMDRSYGAPAVASHHAQQRRSPSLLSPSGEIYQGGSRASSPFVPASAIAGGWTARPAAPVSHILSPTSLVLSARMNKPSLTNLSQQRARSPYSPRLHTGSVAGGMVLPYDLSHMPPPSPLLSEEANWHAQYSTVRVQQQSRHPSAMQPAEDATSSAAAAAAAGGQSVAHSRGMLLASPLPLGMEYLPPHAHSYSQLPPHATPHPLLTTVSTTTSHTYAATSQASAIHLLPSGMDAATVQQAHQAAAATAHAQAQAQTASNSPPLPSHPQVHLPPSVIARRRSVSESGLAQLLAVAQQGRWQQ